MVKNKIQYNKKISFISIQCSPIHNLAFPFIAHTKRVLLSQEKQDISKPLCFSSAIIDLHKLYHLTHGSRQLLLFLPSLSGTEPWMESCVYWRFRGGYFVLYSFCFTLGKFIAPLSGISLAKRRNQSGLWRN